MRRHGQYCKKQDKPNNKPKIKNRTIAPLETQRTKGIDFFYDVLNEYPQNDREVNAFMKDAQSSDQVKQPVVKDAEEHARTHLPASRTCEPCEQAELPHR